MRNDDQPAIAARWSGVERDFEVEWPELPVHRRGGGRIDHRDRQVAGAKLSQTDLGGCRAGENHTHETGREQGEATSIATGPLQPLKSGPERDEKVLDDFGKQAMTV